MAERTVLITGGARGIGLAAAKSLKKAGLTVIIATRDAEKACRAAEEAGCHWLKLDVADDESVRSAAEEFGRRYECLDVLVNNAAILLDHYGSVLDLDPGVLTETLATNVVGAFRVTKAFVPHMAKSADPRIINVSSRAGQMDGEPQPWSPAYSISKTGLNMLTQQLVAALPGTMINSMCPGWCRTEMGGEGAPRTAEQGADTLVWLATEAPRALRGKFLRERKEIPW